MSENLIELYIKINIKTKKNKKKFFKYFINKNKALKKNLRTN